MAKRRKAKTPKRIAGVPIPKGMRRALRPLAKAVDTPLGRQVVAGAVIATAVAIWRDERVRHAAAQLRDDVRSWLRQAVAPTVEPRDTVVTSGASGQAGVGGDTELAGRRAH